MRPKGEVAYKLDCVLNAFASKMPKTAIDYGTYLKGAKITAYVAKNTLYKQIIADFERLKSDKETKQALVGVSTPRELVSLMNRKPLAVDYARRIRYKKIHASPNCQAYARKLRERIEEMSLKDPVACPDGKRPLSAFAKAELDLRHEEQMGKLDKLLKHGYRLCWLSSHADCSPRCAKWQGKLVDIVHESPLPSHKMNYKKDGYVVYSLKSIMAETDKHGYHNTIINGFNCRHHLIPYAKGSKPPKHVKEKERKEEYAISQTLRGYERKIRSAKREALLYNECDKKRAKAFAKEAKDLTRDYVTLARGKGFQAHKYRLEV